MADCTFDLFVVGGGSGGIACARRAASHGARVGVAEGKRWGGTCVNVGCVPKKIMWTAANVAEILHQAKHFGMTFGEGAEMKFSWPELKRRRDANILRLNGIYRTNLERDGISRFETFAKFTPPTDPSYVEMELEDAAKTRIRAKHVVISVGGKPQALGIPGEEHTITSDGFFELEDLPKKVAVIGAGYIAVELAGVLNTLGSETHLFVRGDHALRKFDQMLATKLHGEMDAAGLTVHPGSYPERFDKSAETGQISVTLKGGEAFGEFDVVIVAVGRVPYLEKLQPDIVGIQREGIGYIKTDEFQNTNVNGIYAVGDVIGKHELTPVAIAAGRRLADRLFGGLANAKIDYDHLVPTVIFSHPPIGTVGYTEKEAKAKYGEDDVQIYTNTSVALYYNTFDIPPEQKPRTHIKMVCVKSLDYRVVGLHIIGMGADEALQGFGVAMKMGATKRDFDNCVAIHPSMAEEVVTMKWGQV